MGIVKNIATTVATSLVFTLLGIKLEKRIDKALESRETKDIADDKDLKSPEIRDTSGRSKIDWVSLLKKHKSKIPLIALLFGAATGSSIALFESEIYQYLLLLAPSRALDSQVNSNYFGARDSSKDIIKVKEFAKILETFSLSPKLNETEKIEGYKSVIEYFLEFDSKAKLLSVTLRFASLLAYFSTSNLFLFGQIITALISLIREGKVSTAIARMIVNGLRQKEVPVPKELEELIK
jgi:hypothetical protein